MKYPLSICRIEIAHHDGVWVGDPNSIIMQMINNRDFFRSLTPLPDGFSNENKMFTPIKSCISNMDAVIYRANEYEIPLTPAELDRFLRHDLTQSEFFALFDLYGDIHEIHSDFYDFQTGESMQPVQFEV